MYNIKMSDYVPVPDPATSKRIVAAHCYAAWKKGAAEIHNGFDDLHDWPDRTPLWGYYDEGNPMECDWEIKWAVEHGINCFIHCWYRKAYNVGQKVTENDLRCGHGLHEALFNAKYQNYIKFAIMFEASPRWGATDEKDMPENLMPFWCENYFCRENYLLIDNKPVLFVYNQRRLGNCFKSAESQRETFDKCREYARSKGFDGMIFAANIYGHSDKAEYDDLTAKGYDFLFGYNSGYDPKESFPSEEDVLTGQLEKFIKRTEFAPTGYIPTASCFYDPRPRTTPHWMELGYTFDKSSVWYLNPENFRKLLQKYNELTDSLPENAWARKIMMIDNWNEWDEGHFVAPSHRFGFKYLEAIREEMTLKDNLPDYRTPQDVGVNNFNTTWKEPDFSAKNE